MHYCKKLGFLLLFLFVSSVIMTGCSGVNQLADSDYKDYLKKKGVDAYKTNNLVATNTLKEKTTITKGNLESLSSSLAGFIPSSDIKTNVNKDEVMYKVIEYLNTPYLWGGTSKRGIDCSAFVQTVMYQALGVLLPRTSSEQSNVGVDVQRSELKFGDLLFFNTMGRGRVSHVGIYMSDGYFVHSGSSTGVAVASLESDFYSRVFLKAKRVTE